MSWASVPLRDIADFSNGVNFDKSAYSAGVKLIGVSNFGNRFSPDYDELLEIDSKVVRPGDYLMDGDIVFVRSNGNKELVGRCMLIKEPQYAVTYSGFCIRARIKDTTKYDPTFFAYYFKSKAFRKALSGNAIGANIQNLSQGRLSNHIACVPNIEIQRRIASVLSTYDDLIENNQKQIKLLEEAAQRLYKEWFVDLRFPGHETTSITDGIPQGWEGRNIDDVFSVQYGKMLPTSMLVPNGEYPVYGANGVIGHYTKANCFDYVTLITSRGNGSGDVLRTHHKTSFVTNNSFVVLPKETYVHLELPFAYHLMKTLDFKSICTGSAQPQLTNKSISMLNVIVPTPAVVKAFCNMANPMFAKIELLYKQIQVAAEARDRLLPKLMNGEIEV